MVVFTLYTMVDGFFVARYEGELALSAVNIAMPYINGLFGLAILFSVGTQTVVGVELGKGNVDRARQIFTFVTIAMAVFATAITLVSTLFAREIAILLGASELIMSMVLGYLRIIIWFAPCFVISYNFEVMVKIDGFPFLATIGVLTSAVTNIVLDYVFVGVWKWGVEGAAIATGISQLLSVFIYMWHFVFGRARLRFVKHRAEFSVFSKIIPIGFGDFVAEIGVGTVLFIYNHFLMVHFDEIAVASFSVIGYVNQVVAMCFVGITQGIQPLVSYYYGSGEHSNIARLFRYALISVITVGTAAVVFIFFEARSIYSLFFGAENFGIIESSVPAIRRFSAAFLFMGFNLLMAGFSSALMKPRYSIAINISRTFAVLLLAMTLIAAYFEPGALWYGQAVAEACTLLISLFACRQIWRSLKLSKRSFISNEKML